MWMPWKTWEVRACSVCVCVVYVAGNEEQPVPRVDSAKQIPRSREVHA